MLSFTLNDVFNNTRSRRSSGDSIDSNPDRTSLRNDVFNSRSRRSSGDSTKSNPDRTSLRNDVFNSSKSRRSSGDSIDSNPDRTSLRNDVFNSSKSRRSSGDSIDSNPDRISSRNDVFNTTRSRRSTGDSTESNPDRTSSRNDVFNTTRSRNSSGDSTELNLDKTSTQNDAFSPPNVRKPILDSEIKSSQNVTLPISSRRKSTGDDSQKLNSVRKFTTSAVCNTSPALTSPPMSSRIRAKPSILKHIDQSSGTPRLSKVGREEIMKTDNAWKTFLKVFFRSKRKQNESPKSPSATCLTIPQTVSPATVTLLNAPLRAVPRPRTRQCPLQRSNSLHATQRHIAILESIEEESLIPHLEESTDFDPDERNGRPSSTDPTLPCLEKLLQKMLITTTSDVVSELC